MSLGHWAKSYLGSGSGGSGGGGNANILIVHATAGPPAEGSSEPTITLDKTYAEIDAAVSAGALVFVDVAGSGMFPFVGKNRVGEHDMTVVLMFSMAYTPNGTTTVCSTLELTSSDSVRLLQHSSGIGG